MRKKVIIVGAGMGGVTAALKLAIQGFDVTVVEQGQRPGGKLREQHHNGQRYYTGPTVLTMPWIFEAIFAEAGTTLTEHVRLHQAEILARHAWSTQEVLDLFGDHEQSAAAIARFSNEKEAAAFRRFARDARRVYKALEVPFMRSQRPTPISIFGRFGLKGLAELMQIKAVLTLWNALDYYFKDYRLRQLFGRYATYVGSSPYLAPATLMLIADVESRGVYSVEGGIHQLPEALARLANHHGADFRYNEPVATIDCNVRGHASGVTLASGERLIADVILFNGDASALGAGLLGTEARRAAPQMAAEKRSHSVLTWNFLAKPEGFPLQYHNVFFPRDYAAEFEAIFKDLQLPKNPTVYLCAQDRGNPSTLPLPGTPEQFLIVVNAPARGDTQILPEKEIQACEEQVFQLMQQCGLSLTERQDIALTTPVHFEKTYPASGGAVFGRVAHGWNASFDRPASRSKIPGLYLAGGSVHPGPGIPMAAISGQLAVDAIMEDHR
jgi:1-hydroxycarotenoid 3,4-desaturase